MEKFFYISPSERQEIKECGKIYFDGGNPLCQEETKDAWKKWEFFFDSFLIMRDARYGNILHLPFSGGVIEQPSKTMSVYRAIDDIYVQKIADDMEKALRKR